MREMKDSGIEWIGEIPNDWDVSKIKFVADFEPTCNFENVSPEDRIAYAPMECIKQGFYEARDAQYEELSHSLTPFQNGDIVMAKVTPCFENGNIAIMNELPSGIGLGSSELFVFRAKNIVAKYLFYWLQNSDFIQRACSTMTGVGGLKRVSPFFCKNCEIHIPPYNEQGRIADYLDRKCSQIDTIIARQQEVIEKLKAYKLSVITEAVAKGLNPDVPMKDSGVEWIGKIPEHWMMLKLKYASSILRGKFNHRPRNDPAYYDGNHPFVQTGDVARANKYIKNYSQTLNEKGYAVSKEFPVNSICMTIAANVGDVAILTFDACFPDSVVGFVPSSNITWNYLYYVLTAMKKQFVRNAIISTQLNLNIEIIKEEFIPVAPLRIQKQISKFLDDKCLAIDRTISAKQSVIDKLTNYRKSLIYEVVTGKKEV